MSKDEIKTQIFVKDKVINVIRVDGKDYISLTDLARYADNEEPRLPIRDWMRNKEVISYLGLWESIHNENFKGGEFATFKNEAGSNTFKMSPQKWIKETSAIGMISKSGNNGCTYARSDIVRILTDSDNPQVYWRVMKKRLKDEGNETVTNCNALKLKAQDGKYRMTDVVDIEGMFRIIESIPSKNAEPIKQWLAKLGSERIDETFDPSITVQRAIDTYRAKGYPEEWIIKRIKGIQDRKK